MKHLDYQATVPLALETRQKFWRSARARNGTAFDQMLHVWLPSGCAFGATSEFLNTLSRFVKQSA